MRVRFADPPSARRALLLLAVLAVHLGIMVSPAHAVAGALASGQHGAADHPATPPDPPAVHATGHRPPTDPLLADHGGRMAAAGAVSAAPVDGHADCALDPGRPPAPPAAAESPLSQRAPAPPGPLRPRCRLSDHRPGHRTDSSRLRVLLQVFRI